MNEISVFLANNYIWFIIIDAFLLFALIGYFFESKTKKKDIEKTEILDTIKYEDKPEENVEELKEKIGDKANDSLNSVVNTSESKNDVEEEKTEIIDIPAADQSTPKEEVNEESTFQA